jgi:hypothetical protein
MASPPFNPSESTPGNSDFIASFPANERTFRDVIESWLLFEHDRSGHHAILNYSTANRDADSTWPVGSLVYNTTTGQLQHCTAIGPVTWVDIGLPSGTKAFFAQTAAPTGWTKVTDAAYNDAAIRLVTGSVAPTGGTAAFSSAFAARTISQANLPSVNFTGTSGAGTAHHHLSIATTGGQTVLDSASEYMHRTTSAGTVIQASEGVVATVGRTTDESAHTHSLSVSSGGSGTAMDFAVKYVDAIVATRN